MQLLRDVTKTVLSARWFALGLLLALIAAGFNGLMVVPMALGLSAILPGPFAQMTHFTEPHHRMHDLTFAFLFLPAIVGVLAQLRRPRRNIAGMWTALVPSAALLLTLVLTLVAGSNARVLQPPWLTVMAGVLMATALHPSSSGLLAAFRVSRASRALLALTVIAAVPLVSFAAANIGLQSTVGDDHAAAGHYGFMAAFAFTVIGVGLLASLRADGWRLAGWIAGLLPVLLGFASLIYSDASSSVDPLWAFTAIGWGAAYVATAELTWRAEDQHALVSPPSSADEGAADATAGAHDRVGQRGPGGFRVAGVVVGILILLVVAIALIAGAHGPGQFGPGEHGPGGRVPETSAEIHG